MEKISEPRNIKARKKHICNWCGGNIHKGDIYNNAIYKSDEIYTWKSHLKCMELVYELNMEGDEGITSEDFREYITKEFRDIKNKISNDFITPTFTEQMAFVYDNRCGGNCIIRVWL